MGSISSHFSTGTHTRNKFSKIIMNPLFVAIFSAAALSVADATFILTTAATATTGVVTVSTGAAALGLLGGVALLKGLLFGALASRSKKMTKSKERDLLKTKVKMLLLLSWPMLNPLNA